MQDGGFDEPITPVRGVSDFGEETIKPKKSKTTETRSKNAKQTSKSGSKKGKKKKKKSSSGKTVAIAARLEMKVKRGNHNERLIGYMDEFDDVMISSIE